MKKIKCLIVDDEPVAQRILEGYLADLSEFEVAGKCLNALVARDFLEKEEIDLMFLDLEMPKLKGFSFLKTLTDPPAVIITTAYRENAIEGFELEVLDYLLKPISFERFLKAINRYKRIHLSQKDQSENVDQINDFLYVKSDRKTVKLRKEDISFVEGMNNYVKIHCGEEVHTVYASMQNIQEELSQPFIRIHRSFIVNKNKVTAFTQEQIELEGKQFPIGNTYKDCIREL